MKAYRFVIAFCLALGAYLESPRLGLASTDQVLVSNPKMRPPVPGVLNLRKCTSESALDCVESISIGGDNGTFLEGFAPETQQDWMLNCQNWKLPGLISKSANETICAYVKLYGQGTFANEGVGKDFRVSSRLQIMLSGTGQLNEFGAPANGKNSWDDYLEQYPALESQSFRMVFRLSWLDPAWAQSSLFQSNLKIEKIAGGSRLMIEGKAGDRARFECTPGVKCNVNSRTRADYISNIWSADIMDKNDLNFKYECSQFGYPFISGNMSSLSTPSWDGSNFSLQISGPHFRPDGNLYLGYYEAILPEAYLKCLWERNVKTLSSFLRIEVLDENGVEKVATTTLGSQNGNLIIKAYNFTYSRPKIRLVPKSRAVQSSLMSCKKGLEISRIRNTKSGCPKGWIKIKN